MNRGHVIKNFVNLTTDQTHTVHRIAVFKLVKPKKKSKSPSSFSDGWLRKEGGTIKPAALYTVITVQADERAHAHFIHRPAELGLSFDFSQEGKDRPHYSKVKFLWRPQKLLH